jgi:transcription elongation factor Elf1
MPRRKNLLSPILVEAPPAPVSCPRCDHTCTVVRMTVQDGTRVQLHSCHFCEQRWWTTVAGATIDVTDLLTRAEVIRLPGQRRVPVPDAPLVVC